jgi:2-polyprenyl-3-methyl-5-hydroxy-6-metoxy-1,4-benzoquinol methylase
LRLLLRACRKILALLHLDVRRSVDRGVSLLGICIYKEARKGPHAGRSHYAMKFALSLQPKTVLDVGAGDCSHAQVFATSGARVSCVDLGTSVYALARNNSNVEFLVGDFNSLDISRSFDLVWASHVLEHQRNVGSFLERLVSHCKSDGWVVITVPDPHRDLLGGHLTLWTPGLLLYNLVMVGLDMSEAKHIRGTQEFTVAFRPKRIGLPATLTFDSGDIEKLASLFPKQFRERCDQWTTF